MLKMNNIQDWNTNKSAQINSASIVMELFQMKIRRYRQ